jgi:phage antirepressor YoqD-like protein
MNNHALDLRKAAHHLQQSGIDTGERRLIAHLVERRAIRKTLFGYEVTPEYRYSGYFVTDIRKANINTSTGRMQKDYTVVQVTGDGLSWLRDELQSAPRQLATAQ